MEMGFPLSMDHQKRRKDNRINDERYFHFNKPYQSII